MHTQENETHYRRHIARLMEKRHRARTQRDRNTFCRFSSRFSVHTHIRYSARESARAIEFREINLNVTWKDSSWTSRVENWTASTCLVRDSAFPCLLIFNKQGICNPSRRIFPRDLLRVAARANFHNVISVLEIVDADFFSFCCRVMTAGRDTTVTRWVLDVLENACESTICINIRFPTSFPSASLSSPRHSPRFRLSRSAFSIVRISLLSERHAHSPRDSSAICMSMCWSRWLRRRKRHVCSSAVLRSPCVLRRPILPARELCPDRMQIARSHNTLPTLWPHLIYALILLGSPRDFAFAR